MLFSTLVVAAGLIIGVLLGLLGGGGSILTVPLLVYVVGIEAKSAIATSLLIVGMGSLAALIPHSRWGRVNWRVGFIFGFAGMAGAYVGGRFAVFVPDALLLVLFAFVMFGAGTALLRKTDQRVLLIADAVAHQPRLWWRIVVDGLVVGIVTGLVGAGGGFLVVPALTLLGGLPMHIAVGTSLLVISLKSFAGLAGYVAHAPIDSFSAAIIGTASILGTLIGSRVAHRISAKHLQRGFGIFVLCVAAALIGIEGSEILIRFVSLDRALAAAVIVVLECAILVPMIFRLTAE
jgi:uncharacterized protein